MWAWLRPRLDLHQGHVHFEDAVEPNGELQRLLTIACHLFYGNPVQVNVDDILQALGDRNRAVVLGAMGEFCG